MSDPWEIATWKFEQIGPLLDPKITECERRNRLRELSSRKVPWPALGAEPGKIRRLSARTLRRWVLAHKKQGLIGLLPKVRSDKGRCKAGNDRSRVIQYALGLLYVEPNRSLTQLLVYLGLEFPELHLSRSTLHRDLLAHPAYRGIELRRQGRKNKLRSLYECVAPHECWQLDGKGPF